MSSPKRVPRPAAALALLATLALGGCLRPLYGPTASGMPLQTALAAVQIDPVSVPIGQERLSHYLRNELAFDLDGSGRAGVKSYKLEIGAAEILRTPLVDTSTGRADSATLVGEATYTLATLDGGTVVTSGKAVQSVTYDRSAQRFATVRAARDAEIRLAKVLAEQIKTRLAAELLRR